MQFSERMDRIKPSGIRAVQKRMLNYPKAISFAGGLPDPSLFPLEDLEKATSKLIREQGQLAFQYGLTRGYQPLIDALAARLERKEQIKTTPDNIIITTGSQQGLALCAMMLLDEGDIVVAENPSYLGGINACRPYGASFIGVDTDDEGIDVEQLDKVLSETPRAKMMYVIPNFQNPTGKAWSYQRRKDFMEVINKHDIIVVEDNPYGELRFKGEFVPSLKALDTQGKVVYLGSFSKILAPGLRLAYICADKTIIKWAEEIKESWDLQCNQFTQMQVLQYMNDFDLEAHIKKIQNLYRDKCNLMLDEMKKEFPESVRIISPEGGMFIWAELPESIDANELLDKALEAGVAYIPGESFFANGGPKNTIRFNFTTVSEDEIKRGVKILGEVFKKAF